MGFLCHLCGKEFTTKQNYTRHWTSLHEEEDDEDSDNQKGFGRLACTTCGKQYKRKENLQKHIVSVHKSDEKECYLKTCEFCDKKVDRGGYKRHLILKHRPIIGEFGDKPIVHCSLCSLKFNSNSSLAYHKRKIHKIRASKPVITLKCPLCDYSTKAPSRNVMQSHFSENHNIIVDYKVCNFRTLDEFFTWKSEIEKQTTSKFIRAKTKSDVIMFKCHRSGKYNPMTNKRNVRTSGSCKINGFCPAFIKAKIIDTSNINVTYQLTHVGHENELRHISLTADERKAIAILLAKKVPFDEILKRIRGSLKDAPLQRIHLTDKKDIHNIKKAFDLNAIAVEHPFNLKDGEDNMFNLRTETIGYSVDPNGIVELSIDQSGIPFENSEQSEMKITYNVDQELESNDEPVYNSFINEQPADAGMERNILNIPNESVEHALDQNCAESSVDISGDVGKSFDYNSIVIQHSFDTDVDNTYEIKPMDNAQFISQNIEDSVHANAVEHVYDFNGETVTYSFDVNVDGVEYANNFNTEIIEQSDDTEEAVKNLLKLNKTEFKQFLDPESLNKWVQNLRSSQNTSLAVYKPQGYFDPEFTGLEENDFLLIYMTEAQKDILIKDSKDIVLIESTQCHDIYLYALVIPDETRDGFPAAFMFTSRGDQIDMYIFFEKIKEVVGILTPKAFMTNIQDVFYSAWAKAMGENPLHLYCSRYVLQAWRADVNGKIKTKEKRNQVFKTLQSLLYELDEGSFHNTLEENLLKWSRDENLLPFYNYFNNLYVTEEQYKKWAYYCRVNAGINTSVSIDSFNRILKYCNLRGEKVKSSDKTLCDVLNLLRVKVFELVIKINKGKVAKKLQNLRLRHGHSYTNDSEYVIQEEDKWQVLNYVGEDVSEVYTVKKLKECNKCLLQCQHCNSCFHEYVCSCSDHILKNNMCKHIHLVARTQKLMESNENVTENSVEVTAPCEADSTTECSKLQEIGVVQVPDTELPFAVRKRQFIEEIRKCFEEKIVSVDELEHVKKQCQPILSTIKMSKIT